MTNYPLPSDYQAFIHKTRYARWLPDKGRRETWEETVDRYMQNVVYPVVEQSNSDFLKDPKLLEDIRESILFLEVMPSMRALMTAGEALDRTNVAGYNCAYLPVDHPKAFDEAMYILLCGTGVGFSVERQYINKLPTVPDELVYVDDTIVVPDTKEGWAKSLRKLISYLYNGEIPLWDVSRIRSKGARLKTFGGRASGPGPLVELLNFTVSTFKGAVGRKLSSVECHDLMCKIGNSVVVGGVRRSAMISLSNLSDDRMRHAKSGQWFDQSPHRSLANNSVAYTEKPDAEQFMEEWLSLVRSKSGERGVFNREAAQLKAMLNGRRDRNHEFGTNPCSEIILRPYQFCNLTEAVVRRNDDLEDIAHKVRIATILGSIQATLTNFPYLRKIWQKNTEEERLLGVSLTGVMDHPVLNGSQDEDDSTPWWLNHLRDLAIETNAEAADALGIPQSAAITCVKPSGTVSQLVDSASGLHARHSPFYIRTVRADNTDPLTSFLKDQGVPHEPCVFRPDNTTIFSFPIKSPDGAICRDDRTALQQLAMWLQMQNAWCEHKPSITVSVKPEEWFEVGAFVYRHFNQMSGVSFLPTDDHVYQQAPYQEIDEDTYQKLVEALPESIDWDKLSDYEDTDNTTGTQTLACTGASCELVDLT